MEITVGVYNTPPMGWHDADGNIQGIVPYLSTQLIDHWQRGHQLNYRLGSTERMMQELLRGDTDLTYTIGDPRLENNAIKVAKLITVPLEAWSLKTQPLKSVQALRNATLATLPMYKDMQPLQHSHLIQQPVSKDFLRLLHGQRVDGVVAFRQILMVLANNDDRPVENYHQLPLANVDIFLWMSRHSPLAQYLQPLQKAAAATNTPASVAAYLRHLGANKQPNCGPKELSAQSVLSSRASPCR
tara:strand:- start:576 stop:1304 length:729 start_codon:yes stop_codon:yes gene_type:complete